MIQQDVIFPTLMLEENIEKLKSTLGLSIYLDSVFNK